jgi:beta-phosphoglucomutase
MNKAVLFDLDGVLVDACDWHYEALNRALYEVAEYKISREDHESTYNGLPTKVKLNMLIEEGVLQEKDLESISDLKQKFTIEVINELCTRDQEKVDMVLALKSSGWKVACVTNSIRKTTKLMLSKTGILHYMDVIITNEDIAKAKPDPEGYIKALKLLEADPDLSIIVEDSPKGLEAAYGTGCEVIEVENATQVTRELFNL